MNQKPTKLRGAKAHWRNYLNELAIESRKVPKNAGKALDQAHLLQNLVQLLSLSARRWAARE